MFGRKPVIIAHPLNDELYQYHLGRRFDPGAGAEAFDPLFANPVLSFRGAARLAGSLRAMQPPQVVFKRQQGVVGLGGIQHGQWVTQPLLDLSRGE